MFQSINSINIDNFAFEISIKDTCLKKQSITYFHSANKDLYATFFVATVMLYLRHQRNTTQNIIKFFNYLDCNFGVQSDYVCRVLSKHKKVYNPKLNMDLDKYLKLILFLRKQKLIK